MRTSYHSQSNETKIASHRQALPRGAKTIRLPYDEATHNKMLSDANYFKQRLEQYYQAHPELSEEISQLLAQTPAMNASDLQVDFEKHFDAQAQTLFPPDSAPGTNLSRDFALEDVPEFNL